MRVERGEIDTVLLALTDMQGRLQGKRLTAQHFLEEVAEHGAEGCNYLLAVDVDMNTVDGYEMSSWEKGYGDFGMRPGPRDAAAGAVAGGDRDVPGGSRSGRTAPTSRPRRARCCAPSSRGLRERGWSSNASTELEFLVFRDSYEDAWRKGYRDLEPANLYNVDYSLLGTARVEPLIRRIRNAMTGAGLVGRELQGRVQPRPARDQLPLRRRAAHRRRALDLQERGQGDRRAGGHVDQLHGEVQRARGQLVPHPLLAFEYRRRRSGVRKRSRGIRLASSPASSRACAS